VSHDERLEVSEADGGRRLDQLLAGLASVGSRGKARRALSSGKVRVDGELVGVEDAGRFLAAGAVLELRWNQPGTSRSRAVSKERLREAGVKVLYEDTMLLALDKPPGLLTDAATRSQRREEDTLTHRARALVGRGDVWPVHRIDRNTSGVVLFAKGEQARMALKAQWEGEKPRRVYIAFLRGGLRAEEGWWEHPMRWNRGRLRQEPCSMSAEGAVLARSHFRVVERLPGATVVEVVLDTGRRNQIRLSASLVGHPLVGETMYKDAGKGRVEAKRLSLPSLGRQALHARELVVLHPDTGEAVVLESPLPDDLQRWLGAARRASGSGQ
jgi:23S rRNA pseudouridine1911/1915/1917 synthase